MIRMKHLLILPLFLFAFGSLAQPGMYTEADMEFQDLFISAELAKYKGEVPEQIGLLEKVIKRQKDSDAAYNELSRAYRSLANYEMAEKHALKAHSLAPQNEWYLLNLADIYSKRDNFNKAIEGYNKLIKINPRNPAIYHQLALIQTKSGKGAAAAQTLEALQDQNGLDEETSRRIFDIYREMGNEEAAIQTLNKLIAERPENTRLMNNLATYLMQTGRQKEAQKVYGDILKINPIDPAASLAMAKKGTGNTLTGTAEELSALTPLMENMNIGLDNKIKELMPYISTMKRSGAATESLDNLSLRLSELYPEEAKVHALRGDVLFYQGKFEDSKTNFEKAIKMDDRNFALWNQYMLNLWELSDTKSLLSVSEEAMDLYPNKVTALLYHALALHQSKDGKASDIATEAGFIAGANTALQQRVKLVQLWISGSSDKSALSKIKADEISEPLYLDLAADLYASVDKSKSITLWKAAVKRGANPDRINKKIDLQ